MKGAAHLRDFDELLPQKDERSEKTEKGAVNGRFIASSAKRQCSGRFTLKRITAKAII